MTTLLINDLAANEELDSKAMASVSGGINAVQINGPNVTGMGDIVQANSQVDFDQFNLGFLLTPGLATE